jgi:hypothetical protein
MKNNGAENLKTFLNFTEKNSRQTIDMVLMSRRRKMTSHIDFEVFTREIDRRDMIVTSGNDF